MKKALVFVLLMILAFTLVCNTAMAACSHEWGPWRLTDRYAQESPNPTACDIMYERYERTCKLCGLKDANETHTQMPHAWVWIDNYTQQCTRCGNVKVLTR